MFYEFSCEVLQFGSTRRKLWQPAGQIETYMFYDCRRL